MSSREGREPRASRFRTRLAALRDELSERIHLVLEEEHPLALGALMAATVLSCSPTRPSGYSSRVGRMSGSSWNFDGDLGLTVRR
jgi:hypothetical protein